MPAIPKTDSPCKKAQSADLIHHHDFAPDEGFIEREICSEQPKSSTPHPLRCRAFWCSEEPYPLSRPIDSPSTVIVLSLTSNLRYQNFPGNVFVSKVDSGLGKDAIINVTQLTTIDKSWLEEYIADLPYSIMGQVDYGLGLVLGL